MKNVKGDYSNRIDQNELTADKFSLQKFFFAYSVCECNVEKTSRFIDVQKRIS